MRAALLVVLAGCNLFGVPGGELIRGDAPDDAPGDISDGMPDGLPPPEPSCQATPDDCMFNAVDRPIAGPGETVVVEGTFGDTATLKFPNGVTASITLMGVRRGTAVVPDNVGPGELVVATAGRDVGRVPFRGTTFPIAPQVFSANFDQSSGPRETPSLPGGRDGPTAFVANSFLYVVGGLVAGGAVVDVVSARINADGTIGRFAPAGTMVTGRGRHASVVIGNAVYAIGGTNGTADRADAERATIVADGTVGGAVDAGTSLATARSGHTATIIGRFVYVIGGRSLGTAVDTVERAVIASDGTLGSFEIVPNVTLSTARDQHATVVARNKLYVIGGKAGAALRSIEEATILPDGSLTDFTMSSRQLTVPRASPMVFASESQLFVLGGVGAAPLGTLEQASLEPNGALGDFAARPGKLAAPRSAAAVAVAGHYLYLVGGLDSGGPVQTIERASLDGGTGFGSFGIDTGSAIFPAGKQRVAFSTTVIRDELYVIGGQNGTALFGGDVERAMVESGGLIGAFTTLGSVGGRSRHSSAVIGDFLYLLGGSDTVNFLDSIQRIPVNADGTFGTPAAAGTFPTARHSHTSIVIKNRLFVIGGNNNGGAQLDNVDAAVINADGTLQGFAASEQTLAVDRCLHATVVIGDGLFVIGGTADGDGPLASVERAEINPDGTLGTFTVVANLAAANGNVTAAVVGGFLYVFGRPSSDIIERAPINLDGTLGTFAVVDNVTMTQPRGSQRFVQTGNLIYMIGGGAALNTTEHTLAR